MAARYLTTKEFGELAGLEVDTVKKYCQNKNIKAKKERYSGVWLIRESELKRWQK